MKINKKSFAPFLVSGVWCLVSLLFMAQAPIRTTVDLPAKLESVPTMRVAIIQNVEAAHLDFSSPYTVTHPVTGDLLAQGLPQKDVLLNVSLDGIVLGGRLLRSSVIRVKTEDKMIQIEGRTYRADLRIQKNSRGKLMLINEISMEDYLKGVLPWEVDYKWQMEALKAQAIAARTFALFQALKNPSAPFFLTSDVKSQVYGGKTSEHLRTSEAVDATRGQVLTYRGQVFQGYFHSSCGGRTTRADFVWSVVPIAPLMGVQCGFCAGSKYDNWTAEFTFDEIRKKLIDHGYSVGPITGIESVDRDRTGRIRKVLIYHSGGVTKMNAGDFRVFIGADKMRSTQVAFHTAPGKILMTGKGWGHGVGLCQWGAKVMAERGFTFENILRFYYPGAQVTQAYSAPQPEPSEGGLFSGIIGKIKEVFGG
ncbi:MAG: SpoIID/LytB domain-containing protein [Candidatus Omnitrophica bacterium]|nr:SpoIID/LytB domain-containing protein [Candidatus Omnitrophota bacterium]